MKIVILAIISIFLTACGDSRSFSRQSYIAFETGCYRNRFEVNSVETPTHKTFTAKCKKIDRDSLSADKYDAGKSE